MAILEVEHIQKSYGRTEVLHDISFSMEKGQVLSIIGPSGGGKSTLLRCLNFLEFAEQGTIKVNGDVIYQGGDIERLSEAEIRKRRLHFGLVFQSFNLFPQYTVLENVMLAPKLLKTAPEAEIEARARALIAQVGLSNRIGNYPCQLSGGQQQRVAIARALALEPNILCFDEPTSALDPELTGEVLKVICELKGADRTIVIVTHEMEFAKAISDQVIFMSDGIIEEAGTPEQVFTNPQSPKTRQFLSRSLEKF